MPKPMPFYDERPDDSQTPESWDGFVRAQEAFKRRTLIECDGTRIVIRERAGFLKTGYLIELFDPGGAYIELTATTQHFWRPDDLVGQTASGLPFRVRRFSGDSGELWLGEHCATWSSNGSGLAVKIRDDLVLETFVPWRDSETGIQWNLRAVKVPLEAEARMAALLAPWAARRALEEVYYS
jgi:hypothetical protein